MSKAQSSRPNRRYNPLYPKTSDTPTRGLIINTYEPHAEANKRESRKLQSRREGPLMGAGKQWLSIQTEKFRDFFWQQFVAPVDTTARTMNPWPPFKSRATAILEDQGWKQYINASEVWSIIRADRPDIARSWHAVVNDSDPNVVLPYPPLKRNRTKKSTNAVKKESPTPSGYQTPGAGSSGSATPSLVSTSCYEGGSSHSSPFIPCRPTLGA
jgi:hypothetical protein